MPWVVAGMAVGSVVLVVLLTRPAPPTLPPLPQNLILPDRTSLSLDRCAAALRLAGRGAAYPDRSSWRPLAHAAAPGVGVTVLAAEPLPFVCATGPRTVDVSDPQAAVPVGTATLLLTTPSAMVAAAAPGGLVTLSVAGVARVPARYAVVAKVAPTPDTVDGVTIDGIAVTGLAPPALHAVDRRFVPVDRSAEAVTLMQRCLAAAPPDRFWVPAQVLDLPDGGELLVVMASAVVGGCVVPPGSARPVTLWWVGGTGDGPRPFVWLPGPGSALPDLPPDVAAGPARDDMVRMELTGPGGERWDARVGGGTFATVLPGGVAPDPRGLTVRAYDADDRLLYTGPAAG